MCQLASKATQSHYNSRIKGNFRMVGNFNKIIVEHHPKIKFSNTKICTNENFPGIKQDDGESLFMPRVRMRSEVYYMFVCLSIGCSLIHEVQVYTGNAYRLV